MLFKNRNYSQATNGVPFIGMALIGCLPSPLKRLYYRLKGATIGKKVSLGMFSYIQSPHINIDDGAKIAPFTFIRARTKCSIGKRSRINAFTAVDTGVFVMGEDSIILEQVAIGGMLTSRSSLIIGDRVKIFSYSFINPTEPIVIEDDVGVGGGNYIFTHGSWQSVLDGFPAAFGPVTLKRGVWLPWRVFIMPNVTIGEYATIGAGAIVTKDIPARSLAVGSPAKVIKQGGEYIQSISDDEKHQMLLKWFEEFADLLNYKGSKTAFNAHDDYASLTISPSGKEPETVIVYSNRFDIENQVVPGFLISLAGISPDERKSLSGKNCVWFDIKNCECGFSEHKIWTEIRNYLSRYGVRFAVIY